MTTNELLTLSVALYGALVATVVLIWDVWKWAHEGPRLEMSASADMAVVKRSFWAGPPNRVVKFAVYNKGDRATTLTTATYQVYDGWLAMLRRRPVQSFVVVELDPQLPHVLPPGEQWVSVSDQDDELSRLIKNKVVVAEVYTAASPRKPMRMRLRSS